MSREPVGRLLRWLAPEETAEHAALPLTLLVRPLPLLSLALLGVNDHYLKGSGLLPAWATGKISDFAGLVYFPLLLVTLLNLALHPIERLRKRPVPGACPTMLQVTVACVATGLFFSLVQVVDAVADFYARATAALAFWSRATTAVVTMDPTDIVAVVSLGLAWWLGRRSIAQVPPGALLRLEVAPGPVDSEDAARAAGLASLYALLDEEGRAALALISRHLQAGERAQADEVLARLRG